MTNGAKSVSTSSSVAAMIPAGVQMTNGKSSAVLVALLAGAGMVGCSGPSGGGPKGTGGASSTSHATTGSGGGSTGTMGSGGATGTGSGGATSTSSSSGT